AACARPHAPACIAATLDHRLGRAAEPRDQLPHRVRRGAQQPAPGRLLDAPAYGQCPRCERQRLGQRRLRFLFPAQLEFPTCQYSSARRPILSTNATALVVSRAWAAWSLRANPGELPVSTTRVRTHNSMGTCPLLGVKRT